MGELEELFVQREKRKEEIIAKIENVNVAIKNKHIHSTNTNKVANNSLKIVLLSCDKPDEISNDQSFYDNDGNLLWEVKNGIYKLEMCKCYFEQKLHRLFE